MHGGAQPRTVQEALAPTEDNRTITPQHMMPREIAVAGPDSSTKLSDEQILKKQLLESGAEVRRVAVVVAIFENADVAELADAHDSG